MTKILFCNITYMNQYIGKIEEDRPRNGGAWVKKHNDAYEKWNFLNYNGYCYGFVQNKGEKFSIERIEASCAKKDTIDGVTVIWCALNEEGKTVIVGWYENAIVYRYYQSTICAPTVGLDITYFTSAKAEDCYLLPEELRTFNVGRAPEKGKGKGFGQQNYWYAESAYAREELIPEVLEYIEEQKKYRINRISSDFGCPENYDEPVSQAEIEQSNQDFDNGEYYNFLPVGYRRFCESGSADDAYCIAEALCNLYQFTSSIHWFEKVMEIEGETWGICGNLPYLYQQCENYTASIECGKKLLKYPESKDENVRNEIYGIIADGNYWLGNIAEGISWLDKIISDCTDQELLTHTKNVREGWIAQM